MKKIAIIAFVFASLSGFAQFNTNPASTRGNLPLTTKICNTGFLYQGSDCETTVNNDVIAYDTAFRGNGAKIYTFPQFAGKTLNSVNADRRQMVLNWDYITSGDTIKFGSNIPSYAWIVLNIR